MIAPQDRAMSDFDKDRLRPIEVLCSRLLHDLSSTIGAINNGVELVRELGPDEEALALIDESARTAANRLALYRFLYAAGSSGPGAAEQLRRVLDDYFALGSVTLDWARDPKGWPLLARAGGAKLVAGSVAAVAQTLIRGGKIEIDATPAGILVAGSGVDVRVPEIGLATLSGAQAEALEPKLVHWWMLAQQAATYRFSLTILSHEKTQFILRISN